MTHRAFAIMLLGIVTGMLAILILVSACAAPVIGTKAVDYGTGHDFIFSAELRHDGSWVMWIRNDSLGVYCLPTKEMYEKADAIANSPDTEIVWHYKSLNVGSPEYGRCHSLETGVVTVTTYVVIDITRAVDLPDIPDKYKGK